MKSSKYKLNSNLQSQSRLMQNFSRAILIAGILFSTTESYADTADWLAIDLNTVTNNLAINELRKKSLTSFNDDVVESKIVTQNIRSLMRRESANQLNGYVEALLLDQEIGAEDWLRQIPLAKSEKVNSHQTRESSTEKVSCYLSKAEAKIFCDDAKMSSLKTATAGEPPVGTTYGRELIEQVHREGLAKLSEHSKDIESHASDLSSIKLKPRRDGLVTAVGGAIKFIAENQQKKIILDDKISKKGFSIFVRDPSIITWNQNSFNLSAMKAGSTEIFVVTPNRISIIQASVGGADPTHSESISQTTSRTNSESAKMEIPSSLASLEGLDHAAGVTTSPGMSASFGGLQSEAPDLSIPGEMSSVGEPGINGGAKFVRAKAKAEFGSVRLKIVDDRSQDGVNYPVSGVRLKIPGTEFSELTNARGEVEIRDVPVGARLLVDISDDRGYLMAQVAEVVADREGSSRTITQIVTTRRYASLDLAARAAGVVQDMQKSSLCGTLRQGKTSVTGEKITLDVSAVGPFYFNHLGFLDSRLTSTSANGKFCYFNVEPGPVAIGFNQQGRDQLATVVGLVAGRHSEEIFDLAEARHVSSSISTMSSANEQLGSDANRANRYDVVENADVYAVGSGELMVPVDDGVMASSSTVLPFKGRVWMVGSSSDFETTVQAIPAKAANAKQIMALIPNGFVNDMAYFAHTINNGDGGSVVLEHGLLSGHSDRSVKIKLVDPFGHDVGDGWYFADNPVSKAIFFNVPPGVYSALVETQSGHWLAADTVMVYSDSVSVVKTGSQLERQTGRRQTASID